MSEEKEFKGRLLLKVIIILLNGILLFLYMFALVYLAEEAGFLKKLFLGACGILGSIIVFMVSGNRAFSKMMINNEEIVQQKLIGKTVIRWDTVSRLKYWAENQQSPFGGGAVEPFLEFSDNNDMRIFLLKSTYDNSIFGYLLEKAREKGIEVVEK